MYYLLFCNFTYLYLFTLMLPLLCQLQGLELQCMVYCSTIYACSNHFFDALDLNNAIKTLWWTKKNLIEHSMKNTDGKTIMFLRICPEELLFFMSGRSAPFRAKKKLGNHRFHWSRGWAHIAPAEHASGLRLKSSTLFHIQGTLI